jgi:hypothetical protein
MNYADLAGAGSWLVAGECSVAGFLLSISPRFAVVLPVRSPSEMVTVE